MQQQYSAGIENRPEKTLKITDGESGTDASMDTKQLMYK